MNFCNNIEKIEQFFGTKCFNSNEKGGSMSYPYSPYINHSVYYAPGDYESINFAKNMVSSTVGDLSVPLDVAAKQMTSYSPKINSGSPQNDEFGLPKEEPFKTENYNDEFKKSIAPQTPKGLFSKIKELFTGK